MKIAATSSKRLFDIRTMFIQSESIGSKTANFLMSEYPGARIVEVKSHWNIPELHGNEDLIKDWNKVKRHVVVLGVKSSMKIQDNGRSTDFIAPSHANGCRMACNYCYVPRRKGYANPVTLFTNIDKIIGSIKTHAEKRGVKTPNQCDHKYWAYDIGCNNDCSADALLTDNVKELIESFKSIPNAKASFATKYVNRDMLNYDPQEKTRIRFSLMPSKISKVVDVMTSDIDERIEAIDDFCRAGYEVHLNFSPIIIYDGWRRDYRELLARIDSKISAKTKKQLKCEVIFLTHNEKLHQINEKWHPKGEHLLWKPEIQEKKTSIYGGENIRYKWRKKRDYIEQFKQISKEKMPYMDIRYIF